MTISLQKLFYAGYSLISEITLHNIASNHKVQNISTDQSAKKKKKGRNGADQSPMIKIFSKGD